MRRHFYISNDLDDLENIEKELESHGVTTPHIHVLSLSDGEVAQHTKLHEVEAVLRTDVVHGTEIGALVGIVGAAGVIGVAHFAGWAQGPTWIPFVFLSIVVLGFCTGKVVFLAFKSKTSVLPALIQS